MATMTVVAIAEVLGGKKVLKKRVGTPAQLMTLIREGLPADILPSIAAELSMDRSAVAKVVGISGRTLSRRLASRSRLSAEESDRMVRLARVLALANDTLGDRTKASRWLQTPNRALQGSTPFELLDTDAGVQSVETILGRIAYGIYS
ncbi:putative toxin-antitoxin system antitoxin component (TIGR02293 family) [Edaphobacter aggregans]|uniref:Putative toxin-antitoxin system antitoxin component (TIGR02293 family) n=1 Tax=Edaphobacter aggregans TaxID=570835 RepID=A0A3R9QA06_9BACT|nr:antitoxin Xre/MbcA/ParS toxin-binding domain-containing protein [Edaphobacter aggregans]RSL16841.1 putative toxin-antitoxin system antitoxin component (TIGR02293 family) [Edaphobacter aggregans]